MRFCVPALPGPHDPAGGRVSASLILVLTGCAVVRCDLQGIYWFSPVINILQRMNRAGLAQSI